MKVLYADDTTFGISAATFHEAVSQDEGRKFYYKNVSLFGRIQNLNILVHNCLYYTNVVIVILNYLSINVLPYFRYCDQLLQILHTNKMMLLLLLSLLNTRISKGRRWSKRHTRKAAF